MIPAVKSGTVVCIHNTLFELNWIVVYLFTHSRDIYWATNMSHMLDGCDK